MSCDYYSMISHALDLRSGGFHALAKLPIHVEGCNVDIG